MARAVSQPTFSAKTSVDKATTFAKVISGVIAKEQMQDQTQLLKTTSYKLLSRELEVLIGLIG